MDGPPTCIGNFDGWSQAAFEHELTLLRRLKNPPCGETRSFLAECLWHSFTLDRCATFRCAACVNTIIPRRLGSLGLRFCSSDRRTLGRRRGRRLDLRQTTSARRAVHRRPARLCHPQPAGDHRNRHCAVCVARHAEADLPSLSTVCAASPCEPLTGEKSTFRPALPTNSSRSPGAVVRDDTLLKKRRGIERARRRCSWPLRCWYDPVNSRPSQFVTVSGAAIVSSVESYLLD